MKFINYWSAVQPGGYTYLDKAKTIRRKVEENYLGKWPAILTEFKENWSWRVGAYEYRTAINSEEFDASAGSFNISDQHTISSGNENVFTRNNKSNQIYFPVWQHYDSNTATQRCYWADVFEETWTRTGTWTPVVFNWLQPALSVNASVFKANLDLAEDYPNGIKIEVWNWTDTSWKADWVHRDPTPRTAGLNEFIYNRPNDQKAWNEASSMITDLKTWESCLWYPIAEDPNVPYINDTYKTFIDKEIALKEDVEAVVSGSVYKGDYDASTDTPSLPTGSDLLW